MCLSDAVGISPYGNLNSMQNDFSRPIYLAGFLVEKNFQLTLLLCVH